VPSAAARGRESASRMLADAELWATLGSLVGGQYPHALLARIRGQITGDEAQTTEAYEVSEQIRDHSLARIVGFIRTEGEGRPLVVFNRLAEPRTDLVRFHAEWPEPGTNAVAVRDMWDRRVPTAVEDVVRHAEGSLAAATLLFEALDVPAVGYRTYRLLALPWEDMTSDFRPPAAVIDVEHPLIATVADRHGGHLAPAGSLVQLDPADNVELLSLALSADGAVVMRVRETAGKGGRLQVRFFVELSSGPLRVSLRPRQTATLTGLPERVPWAPAGPLLGPEDS
jgi:hypothetical protein